MEIRSKLYPYPVLSSDSDDYIGSSFINDINVVRDGYNLKVTLSSLLDNEELSALIADGAARYVYHIECAQTGFRTAVMTENTEYSLSIADEKLCGRLQICPFIVASRDIPDYVNSAFNEDYRGFKFQIEAGCVMAVGEQANFDINKDRDDLISAKSIFVVIKNADETALDMDIDIFKNKITIKLPEKDHANFKNMSHVPEIQRNLNSLIIIPALMLALSEVNSRDADDRFTSFSSYNWYKSVRKALKNKFGRDLDADHFQPNEIVAYSQRLISSPLSGALDYLALGTVSSEEGDDDE